MDATATLDVLAAAVFEDPQEGLNLAYEKPLRECARYWAIVGTALRLLDRLKEAESVFDKALDLPAPAMDRAEILFSFALLLMDQHQWGEAQEAADQAIAMDAGAPPDRGLPGALIARGNIALIAHQHGAASVLDLKDAAGDFRRALRLAPDPREAPLTHVAAVHNLALVALETGSDLTGVQDTLWRVGQKLRELGIAKSSPTFARLRWARTVVDWVLLGSSGEHGRRFRCRIERALKTARHHLLKAGAAYDALLVAFDLGLLYLEDEVVDASHRQKPAPRWDDLRELTLEAFRLDWTAKPDVASAVVFWRQASLEESLPPDALAFIYGKVRGLRHPDPKIHAHGERWGGGLRPTSESAVFHLTTP